MILPVLAAAVVGGICYLDRTAAFQVMLHRPLVVASLVGMAFGEFETAAKAGAILELLYLARLPVGASIPPDDTGAAVFAGAAAATATSSVGLDPGSLTAILLLAVPCAELGKSADRRVRQVNGRIARITGEAVERGDSVAVDHGLLAGTFLFGATGFLLSLLFAVSGAAFSRLLLPLFGPESRDQFSALLPALPLLGAASVFSCSRTDRTAPAFYLTMGLVFAGTLLYRWAP